ncbi:MAG: hypothetical protein ACLFS7_05010, partial [Desulfosudaceae bacterium]
SSLDGFVKILYIVIPAKAGIHNYLILLDPGLRRGDATRKIQTFTKPSSLGFQQKPAGRFDIR